MYKTCNCLICSTTAPIESSMMVSILGNRGRLELHIRFIAVVRCAHRNCLNNFLRSRHLVVRAEGIRAAFC